jgi:hypothetical protein
MFRVNARKSPPKSVDCHILVIDQCRLAMARCRGDPTQPAGSGGRRPSRHARPLSSGPPVPSRVRNALLRFEDPRLRRVITREDGLFRRISPPPHRRKVALSGPARVRRLEIRQPAVLRTDLDGRAGARADRHRAPEHRTRHRAARCAPDPLTPLSRPTGQAAGPPPPVRSAARSSRRAGRVSSASRRPVRTRP